MMCSKSQLIYLLVCGLCLLTSTPRCIANEILFRDVRVFDGESIIERTNVLVRDGKIVEISNSVGSFSAEVVAGGRTLLPSLIDCHTHISSHMQLRQAAVFGSTTQLDILSRPFKSAR
jgi:cytosine/adenosine deaminase-related metal-dependent hydrolase